MSIAPGTHSLGPDNAKLLIRTGRSGGAAKAGHDLLIEVTSWSATIEAGAEAREARLTLHADGGSLRVLEGSGGLKALSASDKDNIRQTIDKDVLKRSAIDFRSTSVAPGTGGLTVQGELDLLGRTGPVSFELETGDDGQLRATATVTQSKWGIKPYSALFGALKVADDLQVQLDGRLS
jgi:hypothetical protein